MKKRKSVPSGSRRNAVRTPAEFANLEWLNNHINHRAETGTNIAAVPSDSEEEGGDVVLDEANVDEQERPSELVVEDVANSDNDSRASTTNTWLSSSTGGNSQENPNNKSNKYKQKRTTGLRKMKKKSTTKEDVELALLKTASTLADKVMNAESTPKRREADEEDDEDLLYCRSVARRLKTMPAPTKAFVGLQIDRHLL